jgi:hypothetical protein
VRIPETINAIAMKFFLIISVLTFLIRRLLPAQEEAPEEIR